MSQSRIDSFMEAATNVAIGVGVSMAANAVFIPMITGEPLSAAANGSLAVIYTIISLARSYIIRRAFNGRTVWAAIKARVA